MSDYEIEGERVCFVTPDGKQWRMRLPTTKEAADGFSAYRIALSGVISNTRLAEIAPDGEAVRREALVRANTAQAIYLLPVLLENADGKPAFAVESKDSMAEFERLAGDTARMNVWLKILWGPLRQMAGQSGKDNDGS